MVSQDQPPDGISEAVGTVNGIVNNSFREASTTKAGSIADPQEEEKDAEYAESERTDSTWLSRAQSRTEELRKMFHLPPDENVCDEFVCALRKRILLQGRMYICEHYLCFHSHLFGYVKDTVIPLKEVTNVRKRRHCGFPNSIEILWRGGKREFFTSFLSRDDAYRLVMMAWHHNSYAKLFGSLTPSKMQRASQNRSFVTTAGIATPPASIEASDTERTSEGKRGHKASRLGQIITTLAAGASKRVRQQDREDGMDDETSSIGSASSFTDYTGPSRTRDSLVRSSMHSLDESERYSGDAQGDSDLASDNESEAGGDDDDVTWAPQSGPAPPVLPDSHRLADGMLNADVREVFHRLLEDERFFRTFHEGRDDHDVVISPWRQHPAMGRVRELTFVSPVKMRMGISPSSAHCHQTQRYRLFAHGAHLVLESSQTMNDIPFGDHFTVESRWDFSAQQPAPDGGPRTLGVNHVRIPFSKQTIWKKAIEKGTLDSCREVHEDLLRKAQKVVAAVPAALATIRSSNNLPELEEAPSASSPRGHGVSAPLRSAEERSPDVEALLQKIPPEYRSDIARMLLASQEGNTPGSAQASLGRLRSTRLGSVQLADAVSPGANGAPSPGPAGRAAEAGRRLLGRMEPRHLLLAAVLLAILVLQVIILMGGARSSGAGMRSGLGRGYGPREAPREVWVERVEVMQQELAAIAQRMELLGAELQSAALHLSHPPGGALQST